MAATSQADVDALGTLRDMKFNGHADVIRNFGVAEDLRHVAQRISPRPHFGRRDLAAGGAGVLGQDDVFDVPVVVVAEKLLLVGLVDDHVNPSQIRPLPASCASCYCRAPCQPDSAGRWPSASAGPQR
ncbi:hypothetical protein D9M68_915300 [compost metagenome]